MVHSLLDYSFYIDIKKIMIKWKEFFMAGFCTKFLGFDEK